MSAGDTWYAGRFARCRGAHALVDVLAIEGRGGWEAVTNPRKLFPKNGRVELVGPTAIGVSAGEWLKFQVVADPRPGARQSRVGARRMLPRFADLTMLGTVEAARFLFAREGWDGAMEPGHWAIRFSEDRILTMPLHRGPDRRLRCSDGSMSRIACHAFEADRLLPEPATEDPKTLYDLQNEDPLAVHDWSPGADYIAHVIRALAGADDPRLPELITWLELHRDEETGRISAIGTDHKLAFEALRSGELAARLSADREVMAAYLDAVRTDPSVAAAVEQAAREEAERSREAVRAAMSAELADEREARRAELDGENAAREAKLEKEMQARLADRERELSEALEHRITEREGAAAAASQAERTAAAAEIEMARASLTALQRERETLAGELDALRSEAVRQEELARAAAERLTTLERNLAEAAQRGATAARPLAKLPAKPADASKCIDRAALGRQIARCVLLTDAGKRLMARFAAYLLSGEVPILEGPQVEDFSLVAEALIAAGRLVPFDADPTVIAPDDIWSRPGSGLATQVAQAAALAAEGQACLVQLRGIDRSAARIWYPALCSLTRRGLLPRPLLLFATLSDPASEEAAALPIDACRVMVEGAIVDGAALIAPGLLGGAPNATAFQLEPGDRSTDLSAAMATLPAIADLGLELDVATAMRVARVATEAAALAPDDPESAQEAARDFCRHVRRDKAGREVGA